jgi:MFS family permease
MSTEAKVSRRAFLTANVLALSIVSLLADFSTEMIQPILPLFLVGVLGASYAVVGVIFGSADSVVSIVKVFSGWYSDRVGRRKPFTVGGYAPTAFLKPLLYFVQSPLQVFAIWLSDRFGKGVRGAPRDALIASSVDKKDLGKAFGFHRALDTTGAVIGSFFGFVFVTVIAGNVSQVYRTIFVISSIPAIVSVVVGQVFVHETSGNKASMGSEQKAKLFGGFGSFNPRLRVFLLVSSVFALSNFNLAFFILRASSEGISSAVILLLYTLLNVAYAGVSYPFGVVADKLGRQNVVMMGYVAFVITALGFAILPGSLVNSILLFVLYGIYMGISDGSQKSYVSEIADPAYRGTALGTVATLTGLIMLPSSILAGALWDIYGPSVTFEFGAGAALVALALFAVSEAIMRRRPGLG